MICRWMTGSGLRSKSKNGGLDSEGGLFGQSG
jgi:hypothetical protein